jgi:hypothetical protein
MARRRQNTQTPRDRQKLVEDFEQRITALLYDKDNRQDNFNILLPRPVVTSADFHRAFEMLEALIDSGRIDAERAALEDTDRRWSAREGRLAETE